MEPTQREVDRELDASMKMFERVQVGEVAPIEPRRPQRILLALDGSSQDATSLAIASALGERYSAKISVLAACENAQQVARDAAQRLAAANSISAGEKDPYESIVAAVESEDADLVMAPCPFGRNFERIGPDSAGTVIDVLLARLHVPLLAVREPHEISAPMFRHAALRLAGENKAAYDAAAWAVTLVADGGSLELVLVLEDDMRENLAMLLKSMDVDVEPTAEALTAALQKAHVRLHRALQKSAAIANFDYSLEVDRVEEMRSLGEAGFDALSLVVVALERPDHLSQGYARDCVLHSRQPVLVVPRG